MPDAYYTKRDMERLRRKLEDAKERSPMLYKMLTENMPPDYDPMAQAVKADKPAKREKERLGARDQSEEEE